HGPGDRSTDWGKRCRHRTNTRSPCQPFSPRDSADVAVPPSVHHLRMTIVLLLAVVALAAAVVLVSRRATAPDPAALTQLLDANRAVMETERERATAELDGKRGLIDTRLDAMNEELARVTELVREFEDQRGAKLDVLAGVLRQQREGVAELTR